MAKKNFEYSNEELAQIAIDNPDFKSPQFQLYINDILGSNAVLMMPPECFTAYFYLLLREWNEKDCGLPTDADKLVRLSNITPKQFEEIKDQLLIKFFEYKGRYYNRRLLEERIKQIKGRIQRINAVKSRYEKVTEENPPKGIPDNDSDNDNDNGINNDFGKCENLFYGNVPEDIKNLSKKLKPTADAASWHDYVEEELQLLGYNTKREVEVISINGERGRIDLVAEKDGIEIAIELDYRTPRKKSIDKINAYKNGAVLLRDPKIIFKNEPDKLKEEFDLFRKAYPGITRGLDTEYEYLKKKHKDWKEIIPILQQALVNQISGRAVRQQKNQFNPEWQHLKTYIFNRSWEMEIETNAEQENIRYYDYKEIVKMLNDNRNAFGDYLPIKLGEEIKYVEKRIIEKNKLQIYKPKKLISTAE